MDFGSSASSWYTNRPSSPPELDHETPAGARSRWAAISRSERLGLGGTDQPASEHLLGEIHGSRGA